jgi:Tfp pilus assembly protein PilF
MSGAPSMPPSGKKNLPATRSLLERGAGRYSVAQPEGATNSTFARSGAPPAPSNRPERPDPEACFARAERLMKQREYAAALQAANEALRLGGDRAEHEAVYGWLLCLQGGGTELRVHPRAMAHLDRALHHDPLCERANHYKGMVLKRLGRFDEAHQYFLRAMQVNRDNLEAAREVRLYDMRKRNQHSRPSLVNKLLKRFGDDE